MADPLHIGLTAAAVVILCMMAREDIMTRGVPRYLTLALSIVGIAALFSTPDLIRSLTFLFTASMLFTLMMLTRRIQLSDWLIGIATFMALSPSGPWVQLLVVIVASVTANLHSMVFCIAYNIRHPGVYDEFDSRKVTKVMAFLFTKERGPKDKLAMPASRIVDGVEVLDIWKWKNRHKPDAAGTARIIMPTAPYLAHLAIAAIFFIGLAAYLRA